jgi:hypothetical protein
MAWSLLSSRTNSADAPTLQASDNAMATDMTLAENLMRAKRSLTVAALTNANISGRRGQRIFYSNLNAKPELADAFGGGGAAPRVRAEQDPTSRGG